MATQETIINQFFENLKKQFTINKIQQSKIIKNLHEEMKKGLAKKASSLKMLSSFVKAPSGKEIGKYLVLDIGGSNLRIMQIHLEGNAKTTILKTENHVIKKDILTSTHNIFFAFIAEIILQFLSKNNLNNCEQKLGFTFSFPLEQSNINSAKLLSWTKEVNISGVIGKDVVKLLNEAMEQKGINNVNIVSLANDTIATLAKGIYSQQNCDLAIILGTGTNAAYIEDFSEKRMLINTEWGNFNKIPRNKYDRELDEKTNNPKKYLMEKMASGKYIGKLVTLIFNDLIDQNIFSKIKKLEKELKTEEISKIINDNLSDLEKDKLLKEISLIVVNRSIKIVSTLIIGIILKIDPKLKNPHTVVIDGSLYEKTPGYKEGLNKQINLINPETKIKIVLSKDASGIGTAIIAATVQ